MTERCVLETLASPRVFARLREMTVVPYDLVIFDDAHKLAADRGNDARVRKADRCCLAEANAGVQSHNRHWRPGWSAHHLLLLTATPHMGKDHPCYALWRLLEPEMLATPDAFDEFPRDQRQSHFIRRTKEELVYLDGRPLHPKRMSDTLGYELTQGEVSEQKPYDETTDYLRYSRKHDPVVITSLVALSTREGKVLKVLLDKLEKIRKELESDKVLDCIGRILEGVSINVLDCRLVGIWQEEGAEICVCPVEHLLLKGGHGLPASAQRLAVAASEQKELARAFLAGRIARGMALDRKKALADSVAEREGFSRRGFDFQETELAAARAKDSGKARSGNRRAIAALDEVKRQQRELAARRQNALAGLPREPDLIAPGEIRCIEVKGRATTGDMAVSADEWAKACNMRQDSWLDAVYNCAPSNPRLARVQDPFGNLLAKAKGSVLVSQSRVMDAMKEGI